MENETHGSWTVLDSSVAKKWVVRCQCGYVATRLKSDIISGKSRRCADCSYKERKGRKSPKITTHGLSDSPTQRCWADMKRRCNQPHRRGYSNYGGRGIAVCHRWLHGEGGKTGFHCFVDDMGVRPDLDHQLDRIDNDGDYTPENCRWLHRRLQQYNKRNSIIIEAFGQTMTTNEACSRYDISYSCLVGRIKTRGMHPEVALTKPVKSK